MRADSCTFWRANAAARIAALAMLALCTNGCNSSKPPTGQVLARVNGEEITTAELELEARLRGLQVGRDPMLRAALLQELVDRELLAQSAQQQKLDRTPEFLLVSRRLTKLALVQELVDRSSQDAAKLDAQARQMVATNPQSFAERQLLRVDRITLAKPASPALRRALATAADLSHVEALLRRSNVGFTRSTEDWDSLTASALVGGDPKQMAQGTVFVTKDGSIVAQVLSRSSQPVPRDQRVAVARTILERDQAQRSAVKILEGAKRHARIQFQQGYGPAD